MAGNIIIFTTENAGGAGYFRSDMENENKVEKDIQWHVRYHADVLDKKVFGFYFNMDNIIIYRIMKDVMKGVTGAVCELGAGEGKCAVALSNYKEPDESLFLFDIDNDLIKKAQENIRVYGTNKNVIWYQGDTQKFSFQSFNEMQETLNFEKLKLLHIDACHEYPTVLSDMVNFSKAMNEDGVMVLDDYMDHEYPGVQSACTAFCLNNPDWVMFALGQNKAYLCHKQNHDKYLMELANILYNDIKVNNFQFHLSLKNIHYNSVMLCLSRIDNMTPEEISKAMKK